MKRYFVIACVFLFASVSIVSAQNGATPAQTVTIKNADAVPRASLIKQVITNHGFTMEPATLPFQDNWEGTLNIFNLPLAMQELLGGTQYEGVISENIVHIRPKSQGQARPSTSAAQSPTVRLVSAPQANTARAFSGRIQPIPGNSESWLAWWGQASDEEQEWFRTRRHRADYDPCYFGDPGCNNSYGFNSRVGIGGGYPGSAGGLTPHLVAGNGYNWYPESYLWQFFSDIRNRQMYGVLKIDGSDRQHQNIEVFIDDLSKGVASKYDQKINGAIIVRVRDQPCDQDQPCTVKQLKLQFKLQVKDKPIQRITKFVEIEPFEVTGFENMMWQRVTNDSFSSAEIVDGLQQQSLPDELEGGPVPSIKRRK